MSLKENEKFGLFAKDFGVSTLNLYEYGKKVESNLTPYVLEERTMNVTQI